jgi:hypothetical protein
MSQVPRVEMSWTEAHRQFQDALPQMITTFQFAFRHRRFHDRMEAVAEACACAWKAWRGLIVRGRDPWVVGVGGIAGFALRHALKGRKIGNPNCGRGAMDLLNPRAQRATGVRVITDVDVQQRRDSEGAGWKERIASTNHYAPADEAAFRIDFGIWLASLPDRRRRTAELLAAGHGTKSVAEQLGVTAAAVSMTRPWLATSWYRFQGEMPEISGGQ